MERRYENMTELETKIRELEMSIETNEAQVKYYKDAVKADRKKLNKLNKLQNQLNELYE